MLAFKDALLSLSLSVCLSVCLSVSFKSFSEKSLFFSACTLPRACVITEMSSRFFASKSFRNNNTQKRED